MENDFMKDEARLVILEDTARKLAIKLSYEDLKKGVVDSHGGIFRLRDEKRIIVHKHLSVAEKIDVLLDILSGLDTDGVHLPPDIRESIEGVRKKRTRPAKEGEAPIPPTEPIP